MASDVGYAEFLVFQIPSSTSNFQFSDAGLETISCYFYVSCFCAGLTAKPVISGTITGNRLSTGTWLINADILIPGSNKRVVFIKEFS
jgi:hypothetical protein